MREDSKDLISGAKTDRTFDQNNLCHEYYNKFENPTIFELDKYVY